MSLRIRGQEITARISVDGAGVSGSMFKISSITVTPRTDLQEADYIGESESDIDVQHHGYDVTWEVDIQDAKTIDLMDDIQDRNESGSRPQDVTLVVMYKFREDNVPGRIIAYHEGMMKLDEEAAAGRKERVKNKFSAKFKTRQTLSR
jgi:hypothetical protein